MSTAAERAWAATHARRDPDRAPGHIFRPDEDWPLCGYSGTPAAGFVCPVCVALLVELEEGER